MYAKALVLDDGITKIALVASDIVVVPEEIVERVRSRVQKITGIPRGNVLINCSHTHTSPCTHWHVEEKGYAGYVAILPDLIAGAVIEAYHNMEEAAIGVGKGGVPGVTCNRNHPEETPDPEVGVIKVERRDGSILATLVNFACHAVAVGGQYLAWTADYPGYVQRFVEKAFPGSNCLFFQGNGGNIHPWDLWFSNPNPKCGQTYKDAERLGNIVGSEACKVLQEVETSTDAKIETLSETITLPHRELWFTLKEAEETLRDVERRGWKRYEGAVWPSGVTISNIHLRDPGRGHYGYGSANNLVRWAREGLQDKPAELQVVKIGDIVLAANPGELFYQLGAEIKRGSPYRNTFVLAYSNGYVGYISTRRGIEETQGMPLQDYVDPVASRWAYGSATSPFAAEAGEKLVEETLELIKRLG